jgi:hypothetical protein
MADGAAVDTDVLLKAAAYRLSGELVSVLEPRGTPVALGLAHLITGRQLARKGGIRDRDGAGTELHRLLGMLGRLEPDHEEIAAAADLAAAAQEWGLPLDAGEAQLTAIVIKRGLPLFVTGDKRAIGAVARLVEGQPERASLVRRLACFEQILTSVVRLVGEEEVRARVCAEPDVDGAMRLACSCGREEWDPAQLHEACVSFIGAIRSEAGDLLVEGLALT